MIKHKVPDKNYTLDEMIHHLRNPRNKRSLAELDTVVDEIIERNPAFVKEIEDIICKGKQ